MTSYIINLMTKEIAKTFVYCTSAKKLWMELEEHFGESNGSYIYQIQRQISLIEQGNQSIVMYYSRLKKLWEELNVLQPVTQCTCGVVSICGCNVSGMFTNIISHNKLI